MGGSLLSRPQASKLAWFLSPLVLATALSFTSPVDSKPAPVALGHVSSRVTRPKIDVPRAFRNEVLRQLREIEVEPPSGESFVLSASLLRLETERKGDRATSSCVVSATLQKKKGGALVAILRGKARAEDQLDATSDNELSAMRAAVQGAMRGIPKALR